MHKMHNCNGQPPEAKQMVDAHFRGTKLIIIRLLRIVPVHTKLKKHWETRKASTEGITHSNNHLQKSTTVSFPISMYMPNDLYT